MSDFDSFTLTCFWVLGATSNYTYFYMSLYAQPQTILHWMMYLFNMSMVIAFDTALIYTLVTPRQPTYYCPTCEEPVRTENGDHYCSGCCSKVNGVTHNEN